MKKNLQMVFLLVCVTFLLAACGPQYRTDYLLTPPPTQSGRMCANNCLLVKQQCWQSCAMQQGSCEAIARLAARNEYLEYVNQRQREGKEIKRTENSFYRSGNCRDGDYCSAQCENNHHFCHVNCGGQVQERTYCVAHCDQR